VGLLPAPTDELNGGAADRRPRERAASWCAWCLVAALVVLLLELVPPLATLSRRAEYAAALQFSLLAIVVPALVTVGAPWHRLRLAADLPSAGAPPRPVDRLAFRRLRRRDLIRSLAFVVCDLAVVLGWRTPGAVSEVARHAWVGPLEALSLLVFGVGLWLELVSSPPLVPRSGPLRRAVLSAVVMWVFWIDAYVVGLSNHDFYRNFHHTAGLGLSAAADQQIAAVVLWLVASVTFAPVIFWNAFSWLRTEDPDTELAALTRSERRRGTPPSLDRPAQPL
jgi:cytochrome c oxidase assembly factor CtaG